MVEAAQNECNLKFKEAMSLTVPSLRQMVINQRNALEDKSDPMKNRPKGFSTMKKKDLIQACRDRAIPLDSLEPPPPTWEKSTVPQLKLAIEEHVAWCKGLGPYQKKKSDPVATATFQTTSMNDDSSKDFKKFAWK